MNSDQIALFAVAVSLVSFSIAFLSWRAQTKADARTNINNLIAEYRSPEMFYAVKQLWNLLESSRTKHTGIVEEYFERFDREERLSKKKKNRTIGFSEMTIHYSRRLVVLYYLNVAQIVNQKLIQSKQFFDMWNDDDLSILTKVVLPVQRELLLKYNDREHDDVTTALVRLCVSAQKYHLKKSRRPERIVKA